MNLVKFYKTSHAAHLNDTTRQYCSIHCLAEEKNLKKMPLSDLKVVDVKSLKFIDAASAFYVVGSKKKPTMSEVSKYAFANKEDAIKFSKRNKGEVLNFDEALKIAMKDFDTPGKRMAKEVSATDIVYFTDKNPAAKRGKGGHGGHMHGGSRGQVPSKKVWPVFTNNSGRLNCISNIRSELFLLDANLEVTKAKQSRGRDCKTVSFKMPDNGYYNLFYVDGNIKDDILYMTTAKYEHMRYNHSNDAVYDNEKMAAHSIKEVAFDIVRLREEGETFYHRLYAGNKIRVKAILNSKAIEGASVTLSTKTGWSKTTKTDKDGIATFVLLKDYFPDWNKFDRRHKNKFLLTATYTEDSAGEYLYDPYKKIKHTTTYPSVYYPNESAYSSYAYGLLAAIITMLLSGVAIYWYRRRNQQPFKEVKFDEKD